MRKYFAKFIDEEDRYYSVECVVKTNKGIVEAYNEIQKNQQEFVLKNINSTLGDGKWKLFGFKEVQGVPEVLLD